MPREQVVDQAAFDGYQYVDINDMIDIMTA
jgi:hypothetical protein